MQLLLGGVGVACVYCHSSRPPHVTMLFLLAFPYIQFSFSFSIQNAGAIIGKAGSNIKRLRQDVSVAFTIPWFSFCPS